jgi:hypothetical protein
MIPRLLSSLSAVALAWSVAGCANVKPADAQDTAVARARADSIRADSIRADSIRADSIRADSVARAKAKADSLAALKKGSKSARSGDSAVAVKKEKVWPVKFPTILPGSVLPA